MKMLITLVGIFLSGMLAAQEVRTDTIFFNSKWQICEKPFADYYRIGKLVMDTIWYYSGTFNDYKLKDNSRLQTGNYVGQGYRNGTFTRYYANGQPRMQGVFKYDKFVGDWNYYFENGQLNTTIRFDTFGRESFHFWYYATESGKVT
jgi:antitoxin component YwqK of YwqJK toxin-antitoxin module